MTYSGGQLSVDGSSLQGVFSKDANWMLWEMFVKPWKYCAIALVKLLLMLKDSNFC